MLRIEQEVWRHRVCARGMAWCLEYVGEHEHDVGLMAFYDWLVCSPITIVHEHVIVSAPEIIIQAQCSEDIFP